MSCISVQSDDSVKPPVLLIVLTVKAVKFVIYVHKVHNNETFVNNTIFVLGDHCSLLFRPAVEAPGRALLEQLAALQG